MIESNQGSLFRAPTVIYVAKDIDEYNQIMHRQRYEQISIAVFVIMLGIGISMAGFYWIRHVHRKG